jgi:hypothetical protein
MTNTADDCDHCGRLRSNPMTSDDCGLLRITMESHDDSEVTTLRYDTTQRASQSMTPDDYGLLLRSLDHSYKSPRRFRAFLHFDLLFDYLDSCIYNDLHNPITTPIVITLFDSYHNGSTRYFSSHHPRKHPLQSRRRSFSVTNPYLTDDISKLRNSPFIIL